MGSLRGGPLSKHLLSSNNTASFEFHAGFCLFAKNVLLLESSACAAVLEKQAVVARH